MGCCNKGECCVLEVRHAVAVLARLGAEEQAAERDH